MSWGYKWDAFSVTLAAQLGALHKELELGQEECGGPERGRQEAGTS